MGGTILFLAFALCVLFPIIFALGFVYAFKLGLQFQQKEAELVSGYVEPTLHKSNGLYKATYPKENEELNVIRE